MAIGRLELYVDGFSRASSAAAATNTSALFGIYRWDWGFSTNQDFNGDIALILCCGCLDGPHGPPVACRSVRVPAPMERAACALWQCATRHAPLDRHRRDRPPVGVASNRLCIGRPSRDRPQGVHPDLVRVVERAIQITTQDFRIQAGPSTRFYQLTSTTAAAARRRQPDDRERRSDHHRGPGCQHAELWSAGRTAVRCWVSAGGTAAG